MPYLFLHCIICMSGMVLAARIHSSEMLNVHSTASESGSLDWGSQDPVDIGLNWLDDSSSLDTTLDRNMSVKNVNVMLKYTKDNKGSAGFLIYSEAEGKSLSKCMDLQFIAERGGGDDMSASKPSEINAAWIGTMGRDFKAGNPCLLDFAVMSGWLEKVVQWNLHRRQYELWTITDAAAGRCKHKTSDGAVDMWEGTQVLLTPLSLFKYGMPFYTQKGGLFPTSVLQRGSEAQQRFCAETADAKKMGETTLDVLIDELMPHAGRSLQSVVGRMRGGRGPEADATFGDLLKDKSVWMDVQASESDCGQITGLLRLLKNWRCRDFKLKDSAEEKRKSRICLKHKRTVRYMTSLGNLYGRFLLNETKNQELICDWYDMSWKAKFWWRPKFWERWASIQRSLTRGLGWVRDLLSASRGA